MRRKRNGAEVVQTKDRTEAMRLLGKLIRKLGDIGIRTSDVKDAEEIILTAIREYNGLEASAGNGWQQANYTQPSTEGPAPWRGDSVLTGAGGKVAR